MSLEEEGRVQNLRGNANGFRCNTRSYDLEPTLRYLCGLRADVFAVLILVTSLLQHAFALPQVRVQCVRNLEAFRLA